MTLIDILKGAEERIDRDDFPLVTEDLMNFIEYISTDINLDTRKEFNGLSESGQLGFIKGINYLKNHLYAAKEMSERSREG